MQCYEYFLSFRQKHGIGSKYNYRGTGSTSKYHNLSWSSNDSLTTEKQLFDEATYKFTDMVESFYIRLIHSNDDGNSAVVLNTTDVNPDMIKEQRRRQGKCYTFIPEEHIREFGIYYVKIKL